MGMKDEELAGLSDVERAALLDDDDDSDILKNIAGDNGNDDDDDDDDEDVGGGDDSSKSKANDDDHDVIEGTATRVDDGAKKLIDAGAAGTGGDESTESAAPAITEQFQPEFKAVEVEGITEKLAELDTRTAALNEKFKSGEIELPDFMAQKSAIDTDRLNLTVEARQAEWAKQQNADSREQRWKWEQERFFSTEKATLYKDEIALGALNAAIKKLANDPANDRRPPGWFLEEADRNVRERFGQSVKKDDPTAAKKAAREPDVSKLPKTLANLPAADISETGSDEFAYLEKLDGLELEQALRKLTPEQEARYLGASA